MWFKPVDIVYDNTYVIDFLNKPMLMIHLFEFYLLGWVSLSSCHHCHFSDFITLMC